MKIYIPDVNESWVVDRFREEFYDYNSKITTNDIKTADIIWIIAPWIWKKIKRKNLKNKKVLCTIHHFEEKDFEKEGLKNFNKLVSM